MDPHDILPRKRTLIDARWCDPDGAVIIKKGNIAPRGGGHAPRVDAVHDIQDLFPGMEVFEFFHVIEGMNLKAIWVAEVGDRSP